MTSFVDYFLLPSRCFDCWDLRPVVWLIGCLLGPQWMFLQGEQHFK